MSAMRWQSVIWDFNGTLVDDCALAVKAINVQCATVNVQVVVPVVSPPRIAVCTSTAVNSALATSWLVMITSYGSAPYPSVSQ